MKNKVDNDKRRMNKLNIVVLIISVIVISDSRQQVEVVEGNSSSIVMETLLVDTLDSSANYSTFNENQSLSPLNQRTVQSSQHAQTPQESKSFTQPSQPYQKVNSSSQYYERFAAEMAKIQFSQTVNVTNLSNGKQLCNNGEPCQFYYYVIKPKFDPEGMSSFSMRPNDVRNVLIVAGMHGNQYLGPLSVLYSLKHLQTPSTRIILFPLANPSGFDHSRRLVYPTNVDPNRDFPIEQYTRCYQASSSVIIDHIFRKYHIDLTLALHNGQSEIAWNWGTLRESGESRTKDERIYRELGEWLRFVGGENRKIGMDGFRIGTMDEVVYPVEGGFEDWAYAAEWYEKSQGVKPSRGCPFQKYPFNMTNGLVFLFQLGPFDVDQRLFGSQQGIKAHPTSTLAQNGYISRAIRMLKNLIHVPNPRLKLAFTEHQVLIKLQGCKSGQVNNTRISSKQTNITYFLTETIKMKGDVNNFRVEPEVERLGGKLGEREVEGLVVEYDLRCDRQWEGLGRTVFGEVREFKVKETFVLAKVKTRFYDKTRFETVEQALEEFSYSDGTSEDTGASIISDIIQKHGQTITVWVMIFAVILLVFGVVYVVVREVKKDEKQRRMQRLKRKAKKVQERIDTKGDEKLGEEEGSIDEMEWNQSVDSIKERDERYVELGQRIQKSGKEGSRGLRPNGRSVGEAIKDKSTSRHNAASSNYPQLCQSDKSIKTQPNASL